MRVVWTDGAKSDLRELVLYIAEDDPGAARRMAARIRSSLIGVREHPQMGRMVPEFADVSIRERIVPPYRVVYRVAERIEVLAVVHSRRLMPEVE